ncbi:transmembrane domain protein [Mycobacterium xenopi 3993]|nr:transmembrane domain protein [Mycobacterium xenopi 3993]
MIVIADGGPGFCSASRRRSTPSAPATSSTAPRYTQSASASTTFTPTTCRQGRPRRSPPTSTTKLAAT